MTPGNYHDCHGYSKNAKTMLSYHDEGSEGNIVGVKYCRKYSLLLLCKTKKVQVTNMLKLFGLDAVGRKWMTGLFYFEGNLVLETIVTEDP